MIVQVKAIDTNMRVLFISRYFPDDPRTKVHGVYKRMGTFIEALKGVAELDMLFYTPPGAVYTPAETQALERTLGEHWQADIRLWLTPMTEYKKGTTPEKAVSFAKGIFSIFNQYGYSEVSGRRQVRAVEECLERKPDAVFAHRLPSMCPLMLTRAELPPVFFDFDDIEHIVLSRAIEQQKSLKGKLLYLLIPAMKRGEQRAVRMAAETYVCSGKDREYIEREFRQPKVFIIPNAVDIPHPHPGSTAPNLLFLGSDYGANIDAAEFMADKIWPAIHSGVPDAKLIIAGISPERMKNRGTYAPGIEITGFVRDLDSLYQTSRVIVTPILVGGGTRYKIIEAAAYSKPVVSTAMGAEGLEFAPGKEILIRDDPESFAETCIELLADPSLCEKIGTAARAKTAHLYDRKAVVELIRERIARNIKLTSS
jgi:glycosyltransferase involved in cell wall biosynthesis